MLEAVLDNGAVITDRFGKKEWIPGDNVVLATGFEPQTWFLEKISSIAQMPLFAVGDCVQPRKIFEAIHEGYMAGASV
jgi:thioredoxin reductase